MLVGVELGIAMDVLQPVLGVQGFMSPWKERISDPTKLFCQLQQESGGRW